MALEIGIVRRTTKLTEGGNRGLQAGPHPLPGKILACSPSKWFILMHSEARFIPTKHQRFRKKIDLEIFVYFSGGSSTPV